MRISQTMVSKVLRIVLLMVVFTAVGHSSLAQHTVTLYSRTKLKSIPTNIGMSFMVKQFCTTSIDSNLHADRYFFENAAIGKIKSCKLDFRLRNDTVQNITIYLTGHKYFDAAKKQAKKQFGPSAVVMNSREELYTWHTKNSLHGVQINLLRKDQEWGAEMKINSQEK